MNLNTNNHTPVNSGALPKLPAPSAAPLQVITKPDTPPPSGMNVSPQETSKPVVATLAPPALEKVTRVPPKAIKDATREAIEATSSSPRSFQPTWVEGVETKPAITPELTKISKPKTTSVTPQYILDSQCHYVVTVQSFRQGNLTSPFPDETFIAGVYTYAAVMTLKGKDLADKMLNEVITHGNQYLNEHLINAIEDKTITLRTVYPSAGNRKKVLTIYVSDIKGRFGAYRIFTVERIQVNTMYSKVT